mgnify:CR=1 FL=1
MRKWSLTIRKFFNYALLVSFVLFAPQIASANTQVILGSVVNNLGIFGNNISQSIQTMLQTTKSVAGEISKNITDVKELAGDVVQTTSKTVKETSVKTSEKATQVASAQSASVTSALNDGLEKVYGFAVDKTTNVLIPFFVRTESVKTPSLIIQNFSTSTPKQKSSVQIKNAAPVKEQISSGETIQRTVVSPATAPVVNIPRNTVNDILVQNILRRLTALESKNVIAGPISQYITNTYTGGASYSVPADTTSYTNTTVNSVVNTAVASLQEQISLISSSGNATNTFAFVLATSTTATSTFAGNINVNGNTEVGGNIRATAFFGDGSNLTGIVSGSAFSTSTTRGVLSAGAGLGYNSTTGVFSIATSSLSTSDFLEGSNLYFTNDRADARIRAATSTIQNMVPSSYVRSMFSSSATGLTYTAGTGDFSLTSGYNIPLTASTTEWASKVSSQWTTTGANIYYTTGKVGVGTASPVNAFDIVKSDGASPVTLNVQNTIGNTAGIAQLMLGTRTTVGDTDVGAKLKAQRTDVGSAGTTDLSFSVSSGTTMNERMRILGSGNVGIGTTNPSSKLSIVGGDLMVGQGELDRKINFFGSGYGIGLSSGSGFPMEFFSSTGNYTFGGSTGVVISANSAVGIGVASPRSPFDVVSAASQYPTIKDFYSMGYNSTYKTSIGASFSGGSDDENLLVLRVATAGGVGVTDVATFTGGGKLGIGTSTPGYALTVAGDISLTGALRANGDAGTSGMVLLSNGSSAPTWVATSTLGISGGSSFSTSTTRGVLSSSATGITYNNSTGDFSLTSGYGIPLTASTTEWASKVSSQWTTTGSNIYYNTGNIGIGTTTPGSKLTVVGTTTVDGILHLPNVSIIRSSTENVLIASSSMGTIFLGGAGSTTSSGSHNVGIGSTALANISSSGSYNIGIGFKAGNAIISATRTISIGANAGDANQTSPDNVAIGYDALTAMSGTSIANTAVGNYALSGLTTNSHYNVALGMKAGSTLTSGVGNIIIGSGNNGDGVSTPLTTSSNTLNIGGVLWGTAMNTTSGSSIAAGNIGIGTSTPIARLSVAGASGASTDLFRVASSTGSPLFAISSAGNVGVGTSAPAGALDIRGSEPAVIVQSNVVGNAASIRFADSAQNNIFYVGTERSTPGALISGSIANYAVLNSSGTGIHFGASNSIRMTVHSGGNVGIGTTTPSAKLAITGTAGTGDIFNVASSTNASLFKIASTGATYFNNDAGTTGMVLLSNGTGSSPTWVATSSLGISGGGGGSGTVNSGTAGQAAFYAADGTAVSGTSTLVISGEKVGVGIVPGATYKFEVNGSASTTSLYLPNTASASVGGIYFGTTRFFHNYGTANTFGGSATGNIATAGTYNTAYGHQALQSTSGSQNVGMGVYALQASTGSYNIGIGFAAQYNANSGSYNVSLGDYTLVSGNGSYNVALGTNALRNVSTGSSNSVAVGASAGYAATGANNIFLGYQAGNNLTTGTNNIIIGYDIDATSTTMTQGLNIGNLIFGTGLNGTGTTLSTGNIGIGTSTPAARLAVVGVSGAGTDLFNIASSTGTSLFAVSASGNVTLPVTTSGGLGIINMGAVRFIHGYGATQTNVFMGPSAGNLTNTGRDSIGIGSNALVGLTSARLAVGIGSGALERNSSGWSNTAIGESSLNFVTTNGNNAAVGRRALYGTTGANNTAIGTQAGESASSGSDNIYILVTYQVITSQQGQLI